jgi:dTDP-4-dehydrorhamnose 3,5-epimerase
MKIESLEIPDIKLIRPSGFSDERGYFMETFNQRRFNKKIKGTNFLQDNESSSSSGVLRGMHFQEPPYAQGKLRRVITGEGFEVAVELRAESVTFGKQVTVRLNGENKERLYIPRGIAHGFLVMSEKAVFSYKGEPYYHPQSEKSLIWEERNLDKNGP